MRSSGSTYHTSWIISSKPQAISSNPSPPWFSVQGWWCLAWWCLASCWRFLSTWRKVQLYRPSNPTSRTVSNHSSSPLGSLPTFSLITTVHFFSKLVELESHQLALIMLWTIIARVMSAVGYLLTAKTNLNFAEFGLVLETAVNLTMLGQIMGISLFEYIWFLKPIHMLFDIPKNIKVKIKSVMIKLDRLKTHSFWELHILEIFLLVKWWFPFLIHLFLFDSITIQTSLTGTKFGTFNSIRKAPTIFFITFCFFARAVLTLLFLKGGNLGFHLLHGLLSSLWIELVLTIYTLAQGSADSIVLETLTVWL